MANEPSRGKSERDSMWELPVVLGLVVGAALLLIGGYQKITQQQGVLPDILTFLGTAFTGILGSWAAGKQFGARKTNANISLIAGQLEILTAQIGAATARASADPTSMPIAIGQIQQAVPSLQGAIRDLATITGRKVSDEMGALKEIGEVLEAATVQTQRLQQVAEKANDPNVNKEELIRFIADAVKENAKIQEEVSNLPAVRAVRNYIAEKVKCPYQDCQQSNSINLGSIHGDSALPTCAKCNRRFHVHRDAQGGWFTKLPGGAFGMK